MKKIAICLNNFGDSAETLNIKHIIKALLDLDIQCEIICHECQDCTFSNLHQVTDENLFSVVDLINPDMICFVSGAFRQMVNYIAKKYRCWLWEWYNHLFSTISDFQTKEIVSAYKLNVNCFELEGIICFSEFIKHEFDLIDARVVHFGCDHAPMYKFKEPNANKLIKIGTMIDHSLGQKSYDDQIFFDFMVEAYNYALPVEFHLAGTKAEKIDLERSGVVSHLLLSDTDRYQYFRNLDIFLPFNLLHGGDSYVLEAQAVGTFTMGLDMGVYPELCPFILNSPLDALRYIVMAKSSGAWLCNASKTCCQFVRKNFIWQQAAKMLVRQMEL